MKAADILKILQGKTIAHVPVIADDPVIDSIEFTDGSKITLSGHGDGNIVYFEYFDESGQSVAMDRYSYYRPLSGCWNDAYFGFISEIFNPSETDSVTVSAFGYQSEEFELTNPIVVAPQGRVNIRGLIPSEYDGIRISSGPDGFVYCRN